MYSKNEMNKWCEFLIPVIIKLLIQLFNSINVFKLLIKIYSGARSRFIDQSIRLLVIDIIINSQNHPTTPCSNIDLSYLFTSNVISNRY